MRRAAVVVLALTLAGPVSIRAQAPASAPPSRDTVLSVAADIMRTAAYCALITVGTDGQPQSRMMQPQPPDASFVVWLGTNPLSRKVREIERNPRVTLSYFDRAGNRFATLLGRAAVVRSADEKAKHWTQDWNTFYKDQYRGDDFVLLKVTPSRIEVVSVKDGIVNDARTWAPVTVNLKR
jgi:general stress protein 26